MHSIDLILTLAGEPRRGAAVRLCHLPHRALPHRRVSDCRAPRGPIHAGLRGGSPHGRAARRSRHHPADVRRRAAVSHRGTGRGLAGRRSGGDCAKRRRHGPGDGGRTRIRLDVDGGAGLRDRPLGRQHGCPHPRPLRQSRPAHARRTHRGRLARRRRSADRPRAGHDAGDLWWGHGRLERGSQPWARGPQGRNPDGARPRRRQAGRAVVADAYRGHSLARALHAHRPRARAGHLGRVGAVFRCLDGTRRVSRRSRRRPIRVQRARGVRGAADARRVRGPVLRLGRHAPRARLCDERAGPHPLRPRRGPYRQAARGTGTGASVGLPGGRGAPDRGRPGADRRVLVHRRGRGRAAGFSHR